MTDEQIAELRQLAATTLANWRTNTATAVGCANGVNALADALQAERAAHAETWRERDILLAVRFLRQLHDETAAYVRADLRAALKENR